MAKAFLTAAWQNLVMANYAVPPSLLQPYLPAHTELDVFEGAHYISLVGFLFTNTKVRGIRYPFHTTFEEVNLRFYVRYKEAHQWKRGVVFLKELVPKRMITFIANTIYKEKYATHAMKHVVTIDDKHLKVDYNWKVGREWNYLKVTADKDPKPIAENSMEEFITEHYWGYTQISKQHTGVYEVTHPKWRTHAVLDYSLHCNFEALYGKAFSFLAQEKPASVLLAEGSAISVMTGKKLIQ